MTAFLLNLGLGIINLVLGAIGLSTGRKIAALNLFMAGLCMGVAYVLLAGHSGWFGDDTLIFMGMKGE